MSKADILLKKATSFEKLAVFSDRKSFLRSLAQQGPQLDAGVRQGIDSVMKDLEATKPGNPLALKLMDFLTGTNKDLSQLPSLLEQAANSIPGDHAVQLQNALNLASKVQQMFSAAPTAAQEDVMQMPADRITGHRPHATPIDPKVQEALNTLNAQNPFMVTPLTPDGKLGTETKNALLSFKGRYMKNNPNATVDDIIKAVRLQEAHFRLQPK